MWGLQAVVQEEFYCLFERFCEKFWRIEHGYGALKCSGNRPWLHFRHNQQCRLTKPQSQPWYWACEYSFQNPCYAVDKNLRRKPLSHAHSQQLRRRWLAFFAFGRKYQSERGFQNRSWMRIKPQDYFWNIWKRGGKRKHCRAWWGVKKHKCNPRTHKTARKSRIKSGIKLIRRNKND